MNAHLYDQIKGRVNLKKFEHLEWFIENRFGFVSFDDYVLRQKQVFEDILKLTHNTISCPHKRVGEVIKQIDISTKQIAVNRNGKQYKLLGLK